MHGLDGPGEQHVASNSQLAAHEGSFQSEALPLIRNLEQVGIHSLHLNDFADLNRWRQVRWDVALNPKARGITDSLPAHANEKESECQNGAHTKQPSGQPLIVPVSISTERAQRERER